MPGAPNESYSYWVVRETGPVPASGLPHPCGCAGRRERTMKAEAIGVCVFIGYIWVCSYIVGTVVLQAMRG